MRKTITYISPMQAGKVMGLIGTILGLVMIPFMLIPMIGMMQMPNHPNQAPFGFFFMFFVPIFYGASSFLFTALFAWLYNVTVKWTGGITYEAKEY